MIAGELAALLGLTYYARRRLSPRRWRTAHRLTPLVYVLALIHAMGSGTDAGSTWLRTPLLASAVPVAVLFAARVTAGRRRAPRGTRAATAGAGDHPTGGALIAEPSDRGHQPPVDLRRGRARGNDHPGHDGRTDLEEHLARAGAQR